MSPSKFWHCVFKSGLEDIISDEVAGPCTPHLPPERHGEGCGAGAFILDFLASGIVSTLRNHPSCVFCYRHTKQKRTDLLGRVSSESLSLVPILSVLHLSVLLHPSELPSSPLVFSPAGRNVWKSRQARGRAGAHAWKRDPESLWLHRSHS